MVKASLSAAALLFFAVSVGAQGAQSADDSGPEANPARPTIATPATLTPVGYLQFETGALNATSSPQFSSQFSLNEVIRLSVARRLEFIFSSEPFANSRVAGARSRGAGDLLAGVQGVIHTGEGSHPTIAVSYLRRVYNGSAANLDVGSARNSFLILASADVKGFHYDANAIFNEAFDGGVSRAQFGQTISISHPLRKGFGLGGELWHFTQPVSHSHAVGNLWALSYTVRKTLVLDAGFDHGLTGTSTRWEVFAGFTYLLPHKLWR